MRFILLALATVIPAACGGDRDRPAPPQLAVGFLPDSVGGQDSVIVRVAASDPDGIDSLFVIVDSIDTVGADGYFQTSVDVIFPPHAVRSAHVRGQRIPIVASGRDTHGWTGTRDTFAIAKGP